jgi:hypothetical protein
MFIGVTVMTDGFWDVTMLSGRLLPSSGILKWKKWRQQVSAKIGKSVPYYSQERTAVMKKVTRYIKDDNCKAYCSS